MELRVDLPGRFWPSTIVACLERTLAASYGYGYVGLGDIIGHTRWRWEEIHDLPRQHHPGLSSSPGVKFQAWKEGKVSFLWGLIHFWRKTGNSIALKSMLKDMKEDRICLDITMDNKLPLLEQEVQKIKRRLCYELELSGKAA
jgi:hypothetical protein